MLLRKFAQSRLLLSNVWFRSASSRSGGGKDQYRYNNRNSYNRKLVNQNDDGFAKTNVIKSSNSVIAAQQFSLFEDEIAYRRDQAARSVLFKFPQDSIKHSLIKHLVNICHGANHRISNIFTFGVDDMNALVEFELIESVSFIMDKASHFQNVHRVPSTTRFLFYDHRAGSYNPPKNSETALAQKNDGSQSSLNPEDSVRTIKGCNEQIHQFYHRNRIDELSCRVRFFVASIIEDPFRGIFRNCFCIPFGSSLNLTGAKSSDLDLALYLEEFPWTQPQVDQNKQTEGIFRFLTKKSKSVMDDRGQARFYFDLLEFLIQEVLPGFELNNVIKFAKVPIIKFKFMPLKLECDLSMSNLNSSYNTTKLLWLFNRFDERVGPLVFLVKYWATLTGIHQPVPGVFITNYQLTSLVLFYLQKISNPVLIDVDNLIETIPGISGMQFQDESHLKVKIKENLSVNELRFKFRARNTMQLGDLFAGFCEFYSNFDFENRTIYLTSSSRVESNSKKFSLHIESFFDPSDNLSKNVTRKEIQYFQQTCQLTLDTIKKLNVSKKQSKAQGLEFDLVDFFDIMRQTNRAANQLDHSDNLIDEFNQ